MTTATDAPPGANPNSGNGEGFLAFFDYLINRKEMVEATASALRTGCKKVLAVEDDLANLDLRSADVDDIVRRFKNHSRGSMKDRSVEQYEQRFRQSVEMYRKWLNQDPDWLGTRRSKAPSASNGAPRKATRAVAAPQALADARETSAPEAPPAPGMITYPLPLRPGMQARLVLPEDLSRNEAKRITNFVSALAFDEQLAITTGDAEEV
jgi:hypothetical protein